MRRPLVLIPHRFPHNIYVRELGRAYIENGCDVVYSPENFFESNIGPDIVHVQWPEDLYRWPLLGKDANDQFVARLDAFKSRGALLAWTVHNAAPHEEAGSADQSAYDALAKRADIIHHHCDCSVQLIRSRHAHGPQTEEFVAPHGHYFGYEHVVKRDEARRRLAISPDAFVYLHFGAIRGYKGFGRVLDAFGALKERDKLFLVAGRIPAGQLSPINRVRIAYHRFLPSRVRLDLNPVANDEVQLYFQAADAVVLGHTAGLNSGIAVLGMSFGRPVIGPDLGCVEWTLQQGKNLIYSGDGTADLVEKLAAVRSLDLAAVAKANVAAVAAWQWGDIVRPVLARRARNVAAGIR